MKYRTRLQTSYHLINLTPLVDVVFLMLIFFIVTSDILPFKSLNIHPPPLSLSSVPKTSQILIAMDGEHVIYVGERKKIIDLKTLETFLQDEVDIFCKQHPDNIPTIVMNIDQTVDYGSFLQVFSTAQSTGAKIRLVYITPEEMSDAQAS